MKDEIVRILNEWEFGSRLENGEYVKGVKNEHYEAIAAEIEKQVKNSCLDGIINTCPNCSDLGKLDDGSTCPCHY